MHRTIGDEQRSHVFLAGEHRDKPNPMLRQRSEKPRPKQQQKQWGAQCFGVELVQGDISGGGSDQQRGG